MNLYQIDTLVKVSSAFSQVGGAPIDPTTVTLYVVDPKGHKTTVPMASLSHDGPGAFSSLINASRSGIWTYKFQALGNVEVTSPDARFLVQSSRLIAG